MTDAQHTLVGTDMVRPALAALITALDRCAAERAAEVQHEIDRCERERDETLARLQAERRASDAAEKKRLLYLNERAGSLRLSIATPRECADQARKIEPNDTPLAVLNLASRLKDIRSDVETYEPGIHYRPSFLDGTPRTRWPLAEMSDFIEAEATFAQRVRDEVQRPGTFWERHNWAERV